MAEFAVIGIGRFGRAVARNLTREGQAVLAVDSNPRRLELIADEVDAVATADTTDEEVVASLKLDRMACVVVTIGSRATEASLLTVAILRELEVPRIVARAFDERHARLLLSIGANEVLNPEDEIGKRLARSLANPGIGDQIRFGGTTVAVVEAPESLAGQPLQALELAGRFGVSVLAIGRPSEGSLRAIPEETVKSGDLLVLMGPPEGVKAVGALK
jgi:trk/ktr system potassium uptake protein